MSKIDKQIAGTKTMCCKTKWYRKSRANFRCEKCGKDVTLEIMFLYEGLTEAHNINKWKQSTDVFI